MAIAHYRAKRKVSGSPYKSWRTKRKFELGREPTMTKIEKKKMKILKTRGGNKKSVLLSEGTANIYDPKTKKYAKIKIKTVVESPANRHFIRRNILTKGTIIDTEKGRARITNRPGQEGVINAVLIEK